MAIVTIATVCPLFLPGAALPLTRLFTGECSADPGALVPADTLRECCNRGYARDCCPRAGSVEPDAARFLVQSEHEGVVEVAWATEKNHHPVAVGTISVGIAPSGCDQPLSVQARAVAALYRRQRGRI